MGIGTSWRLIAPDLRGYGETTVVPGTTRLDVFAADLAALLDVLGIQDVALCGLSMGGQVAMEFCRQFPHRVRGLVPAATIPQAETDRGRLARRALADRIERDGMAAYADELLPKMLPPGTISMSATISDHVAAMMRGTNPRGAAAALRGRAEHQGYEPTLASMAVPSAVIVGSDDCYTTRADAERMCSLLREPELTWLEGVGHMPNLEATDAFNAAIRRVLVRIGELGPGTGFNRPLAE